MFPPTSVPVGWSYKIHRQHLSKGLHPPWKVLWPSRMGLENTPTVSLQRGNPTHNEFLGYDIKPSDDEAPVMLEFGVMWSTPTLLSIPTPLRPRVVAPNKVLSMVKHDCWTFKLCASKWHILNLIVWNRTLWSFNCVTKYWFGFEFLAMHSNNWYRLTVCKQFIVSIIIWVRLKYLKHLSVCWKWAPGAYLKMLSTKCVYKSLYIYIYKEEMALSNPQRFVAYCNAEQTTKDSQIYKI